MLELASITRNDSELIVARVFQEIHSKTIRIPILSYPVFLLIHNQKFKRYSKNVANTEEFIKWIEESKEELIKGDYVEKNIVKEIYITKGMKNVDDKFLGFKKKHLKHQRWTLTSIEHTKRVIIATPPFGSNCQEMKEEKMGKLLNFFLLQNYTVWCYDWRCISNNHFDHCSVNFLQRDFKLFLQHVEKRENCSDLIFLGYDVTSLFILDYSTKISTDSILPTHVILFSPLFFTEISFKV